MRLAILNFSDSIIKLKCQGQKRSGDNYAGKGFCNSVIKLRQVYNCKDKKVLGIKFLHLCNKVITILKLWGLKSSGHSLVGIKL